MKTPADNTVVGSRDVRSGNVLWDPATEERLVFLASNHGASELLHELLGLMRNHAWTMIVNAQDSASLLQAQGYGRAVDDLQKRLSKYRKAAGKAGRLTEITVM